MTTCHFRWLITKVMIGDRKTVCLNHSPRQGFASIELRVCHQTIFPAGGSYASHLQPTLLRQTLTLVVSVRISHIAFRAMSISIQEGTLQGAITRQQKIGSNLGTISPDSSQLTAAHVEWLWRHEGSTMHRMIPNSVADTNTKLKGYHEAGSGVVSPFTSLQDKQCLIR